MFGAKLELTKNTKGAINKILDDHDPSLCGPASKISLMVPSSLQISVIEDLIFGIWIVIEPIIEFDVLLYDVFL